MAEGRVDSWIWAIRLAKTRSAATALCKAGHVRINGDRAKPAQTVKIGDEVRVFAARRTGERIVEVRAILAKRVSAALAAPAYDRPHSPAAAARRNGSTPRRAIPVPAGRRSGTGATSRSSSAASRRGLPTTRRR